MQVLLGPLLKQFSLTHCHLVVTEKSKNSFTFIQGEKVGGQIFFLSLPLLSRKHGKTVIGIWHSTGLHSPANISLSLCILNVKLADSSAFILLNEDILISSEIFEMRQISKGQNWSLWVLPPFLLLLRWFEISCMSAEPNLITYSLKMGNWVLAVNLRFP